MSKLTEFNKKIKTSREAFVTEGRLLIGELLRDFMNKYPDRKFEWTQYTPYFNDGDACYFSIHCVYGFDSEGDEVDEYDDVPEAKPLGQLSKIINTVDSDIMEELYGDHVTVTLEKGTIRTEECDHD